MLKKRLRVFAGPDDQDPSDILEIFIFSRKSADQQRAKASRTGQTPRRSCKEKPNGLKNPHNIIILAPSLDHRWNVVLSPDIRIVRGEVVEPNGQNIFGDARKIESLSAAVSKNHKIKMDADGHHFLVDVGHERAGYGRADSAQLPRPCAQVPAGLPCISFRR